MKIVIVEKDKIEGYAAAWVAKRMLKNECQIVFFGPGDKLPDTTKQDLLIFGISFSRSVVEKLAKQASADHCEFRMFDNDFKAKSELAGIKEVKVNMNQTPARMAWEYLRADFRVKIGPSKHEFHFSSSPWIIDYSDNSQLWRWPTLSPFFIKTAIDNCYKRELESWDELATRDLAVIVEQGKEFIKNKNKEEENAPGETVAGEGEGNKPVRRQAARKAKAGE